MQKVTICLCNKHWIPNGLDFSVPYISIDQTLLIMDDDTSIINKLILIFVNESKNLVANIAKYFNIDTQFIENNYALYYGDTPEVAYKIIRNYDVRVPHAKWPEYSALPKKFAEHIVLNDNRIIMPDGTDGMNCAKCGEYSPYVEANSENETFVCSKHRFF